MTFMARVFGLDEAHLKLTGLEPKDYRLTVTAHQLCRADNKAKRFDHFETYQLSYDNNLNVFYSVYATVSGYLYNDSKNERFVSGKYPLIKLGKAKYCYINECWYVIGRDEEKGNVTLYSYCQRPG